MTDEKKENHSNSSKSTLNSDNFLSPTNNEERDYKQKPTNDFQPLYKNLNPFLQWSLIAMKFLQHFWPKRFNKKDPTPIKLEYDQKTLKLIDQKSKKEDSMDYLRKILETSDLNQHSFKELTWIKNSSTHSSSIPINSDVLQNKKTPKQP